MFNFLIQAQAQSRVYSDLPATSSGLNLGGIDAFYAVLSNFNYFALAFSIFYSVILYMNFWYWRLFHHRERLHHEAKGVKAIQDAWWIWARYLITLLLLQLALVSAIPVARTIFIFIYLIVLLVWKLREDIIVIAESLSQGFGQIGWSNDWPKKLAGDVSKLRLNYILKLFRMDEKSRKDKNLEYFKVNNLYNFFVLIYSMFAFFAIIGLTIWSLVV
jgi:hypothetical protein